MGANVGVASEYEQDADNGRRYAFVMLTNIKNTK